MLIPQPSSFYFSSALSFCEPSLLSMWEYSSVRSASMDRLFEMDREQHVDPFDFLKRQMCQLLAEIYRKRDALPARKDYILPPCASLVMDALKRVRSWSVRGSQTCLRQEAFRTATEALELPCHYV